jgi:hypothetical protein
METIALTVHDLLDILNEHHEVIECVRAFDETLYAFEPYGSYVFGICAFDRYLKKQKSKESNG